MAPRLLALRYGLTNALLLVFLASLTAGGWWPWAALGLALAVGGALDEAIEEDAAAPLVGARPFYDANLHATLPLVLIATGLLFHAIATGGGTGSSGLPWLDAAFGGRDAIAVLGAVAGTGYFYALAGATVAHELVHRLDSTASTIAARALLGFTFNASFESYHLHGHHRDVGTYGDPATARRDEYVLRFLVRSVLEQAIGGWRLEAARLRQQGRLVLSPRNRVLICGAMSAGIALAAVATAGWPAGAAFVAAGLLGRILHELVNYVQHYGLVRAEGTPVAPRHAWDTYRPLSNLMHYNLPRHAHHHMAAARPFWELEAAADAPRLPHGYKTMAMLAFLPPLWRRAMDPLLADWDARLASEAERALVQARGWQRGTTPGARSYSG